MLELKKDHPLPPGRILPDSFDFALNRSQQCKKIEEFDAKINSDDNCNVKKPAPSLPQSSKKRKPEDGEKTSSKKRNLEKFEN